MTAILKATGGPGSIPFLILCIGLGVAVFYFWPRRRRMAVVWLVSVIGTYAVLALPSVAHAIANRLPPVPEVTVSAGSPLAVLVILDGDNRRGRVREAQRVIASNHPETIWVLGGHWILEALSDAGVPKSAFRVDWQAGTTRLQMIQVADLVRKAAPGPVAVIASRVQAPRVAALAQALGVSVRVLPTPMDIEPSTTGIAGYMPSYAALRLSRDALYEHAAILWYRRQSWIGIQDVIRAGATAAAPIGR